VIPAAVGAAIGGLAPVLAALLKAEETVPGSMKQVLTWIEGGPRPDPLPPLPDLLLNDLEGEALRKRAERDGTIPKS